jgi:hypothetical protein
LDAKIGVLEINMDSDILVVIAETGRSELRKGGCFKAVRAETPIFPSVSAIVHAITHIVLIVEIIYSYLNQSVIIPSISVKDYLPEYQLPRKRRQ